jgi:hypothetical protein
MTFGVPAPTGGMGSVDEEEVENMLRRLAFGCHITRMLIEADAAAIANVQIWPPRKEYGGLIEMRTTGLEFWMSADDLVRFISDLRRADRYFDINALSIQNRDLTNPEEPPLHVRMLLTQGRYLEPGQRGGGGGGGAGGGMGGGPMMGGGFGGGDSQFFSSFFGGGMGGSQQQRKPPSAMERFGRWVKKTFWPF